MKAAQINAYGGREVVEINEVPQPKASEGRVVVEVRAAGVNPFDWKIRQGYFQKMVPLKMPVTLGGDFSGVVAEVGAGVTGFKEGDEVFGSAHVLAGGSGSFTEFASANPGVIAAKPKNASHAEAAGLPVAGVSAWQALVEQMKLSAGQKILLHGGAGGIGAFAIQFAKHFGAHVATTASANHEAFVKGLGADEFIDYKAQSFESLLRDYDAVLDTVGGETYEKSFQVLKKGGMLVSMTTPPNQELMARYGVKAIYLSTQTTSERLSKLADLVAHGVLKVHIDKTFNLQQAGAALDYLQNGHPAGKVVIECRTR